MARRLCSPARPLDGQSRRSDGRSDDVEDKIARQYERPEAEGSAGASTVPIESGGARGRDGGWMQSGCVKGVIVLKTISGTRSQSRIPGWLIPNEPDTDDL